MQTAGIHLLVLSLCMAALPVPVRCLPHATGLLPRQGRLQVRQSKLQAIFVFIMPPSTEELEKRLRGRGSESEEQIQRRLKTAKEELARWAWEHHATCPCLPTEAIQAWQRCICTLHSALRHGR